MNENPFGGRSMKNIASALVKAQRAFGPALKTNSNPHFRSKYADLSACVEAVIDALTANGIFLSQPTHECENGVLVETIFLHESGEMFSAGKLHVPATKHDAQGYGSALTYARRYSLMAACGIAPEDDDGNAATKTAPKKHPALVTDSFKASATMGLLESLPPARQQVVRNAAAAVIERYDANDIIGAWDEYDAFADDERGALRGLLPSHVKTALTKFSSAALAQSVNQPSKETA